MAPAQGWHAQIEKCKQFFHVSTNHTFAKCKRVTCGECIELKNRLQFCVVSFIQADVLYVIKYKLKPDSSHSIKFPRSNTLVSAIAVSFWDIPYREARGCGLVSLLFLVQECNAVCYKSLCIQMGAPCLADNLWKPYNVSCSARAGNAPDTSSGWQQNKLIWAFSAEVG